MLIITFNKPVPNPVRNLLCREFEYHIGDDVDLSYWAEYYPNTISSLYADGHELEVILSCFDNIPKNLKIRGNKWRGENAIFILDNYK